MHDLLGAQMEAWTRVEQTVRTLFSLAGYREIRTPVLEHAEVFTQAVGDDTDIVEKQMYRVESDEKEKLVLRPEETAAFVRAVIEHQLHRSNQTQRFFYYLPMFRHERPQKGRLRQFYQFGAELILDPTPEADAEIVWLLDHLLKTLKITEYGIRINSLGCQDCRPKYKLALESFFKPHLESLCEQCQKRFARSPLRILDCKKEACRALAVQAPKTGDYLDDACHEHHAQLKKQLSALGISFQDDPHIVRGLDYYCRTAFEFTSDLLGAQSALAGGGRYDPLATRFGEKAFPAVGFGLGMERIILVLEQKGLLEGSPPEPFYYFAALGEAAFDLLYRVSFALKQEKIAVEMSYDREKGLKALLKLADRSGCAYTVVVGDNELAQSSIIVKDMKARTQSTLSLPHLTPESLTQELSRRASSSAT